MVDKLQNIPEETWKEYVEKAYILGDRYERQYHGCGQCVLAAIFDTLDIYDENVFCAATGLSGGRPGRRAPVTRRRSPTPRSASSSASRWPVSS